MKRDAYRRMFERVQFVLAQLYPESYKRFVKLKSDNKIQATTMIFNFLEANKKIGISASEFEEEDFMEMIETAKKSQTVRPDDDRQYLR